MNVIAFRSLREFYQKHPSTKGALSSWYTILKAQNWRTSHDAIFCFETKSVDVLKNHRLSIDIKGNNLRVILSMNYEKNTAFIKWIGWHKDYEKLGPLIHNVNLSKK